MVTSISHSGERRDHHIAAQPYIQYTNVLGEQTNHELYRLALNKREHFTHSKTSPNKLYPDWRRSKVIYDDQLGEFTAKLEREVRQRLPEVMAALRIPDFDIGSFEIQLTSHNDGEYYKWHTDNGSRETRNRTVTFVYYFHGQPKCFTGGELVIHQSSEKRSIIDPDNDCIVFFDSSIKHEVQPVVCPSGLLQDGRFTLNGWVRKKVPTPLDNYFDSRIFGPLRPSATRTRVSLNANADKSSRTAVRYSQTNNHHEALQTDISTSQENHLYPESLVRLYSDLHHQSQQSDKVDILAGISQTDFYEKYYFMNRPLLLKGVAGNSTAVRTWTPEYFAQHYGSVPVQVTMDRNSHIDYEWGFEQTVRTILMDELVRRSRQVGETNDIYLVARNLFFDNPAFKHMRHDLQPPAEIINNADQRTGTAKLWFGPKGTVTPLHYDEHSILFMQIFGRKHFKLIPSFDLPKLYQHRKYYSAVDPAYVDPIRFPLFLQASVADVYVEPGDILFIPVGWWHWVKSLDISISATFSSFHVENGNTSLKN